MPTIVDRTCAADHLARIARKLGAQLQAIRQQKQRLQQEMTAQQRRIDAFHHDLELSAARVDKMQVLLQQVSHQVALMSSSNVLASQRRPPAMDLQTILGGSRNDHQDRLSKYHKEMQELHQSIRSEHKYQQRVQSKLAIVNAAKQRTALHDAKTSSVLKRINRRQWMVLAAALKQGVVRIEHKRAHIMTQTALQLSKVI